MFATAVVLPEKAVQFAVIVADPPTFMVLLTTLGAHCVTKPWTSVVLEGFTRFAHPPAPMQYLSVRTPPADPSCTLTCAPPAALDGAVAGNAESPGEGLVICHSTGSLASATPLQDKPMLTVTEDPTSVT